MKPLNPETIFAERPYVDPEIGTHEGLSDDELAAIIDLHAALLDHRGMHGAAHDVREAARRLRK
jgi:hypothetical protein